MGPTNQGNENSRIINKTKQREGDLSTNRTETSSHRKAPLSVS